MLHFLDVIRRRLRQLVFSYLIMKLYCLLGGIKSGINLKFSGITYFRRLPGSSIEIGNNCSFLSGSNDNLIGINRPCMLSTLAQEAEIIIGSNSGFSGTVIGAFMSIKIGENVKCGANTLITDSDWHLDDPRSGKPVPVVIEDNVWLGEGVKVLKGVTIGENTLIGAGSVVVRSIPSNVIAAGNPCRILRAIEK